MPVTKGAYYLICSSGGASGVEVAYFTSGAQVVSKSGTNYHYCVVYIVKATASTISFEIRPTTMYTNTTNITISKIV